MSWDLKAGSTDAEAGDKMDLLDVCIVILEQCKCLSSHLDPFQLSTYMTPVPPKKVAKFPWQYPSASTEKLTDKQEICRYVISMRGVPLFQLDLSPHDRQLDNTMQSVYAWSAVSMDILLPDCVDVLLRTMESVLK